MKMLKTLGILAVLFVSMLAAASFASAVNVDLTSMTVKINGDTVQPDGSTVLDLDRNQDVEVKIMFTATGDAENVELTAFISGYEYAYREKSTSDTTRPFDVENGITYTEKLNIKLPEKMDQDRYKLRLLFSDRNGQLTEETYDLKIDTIRHGLDIKDTVFSPSRTVKAGSVLVTNVRVKNVGQKDEEGIKVTVSVPELGLEDSKYVDEIEAEETTTTEPMYIRFDKCTKAGDYRVSVKVQYDEYDVVSKDYTISVVDSDFCNSAAVEEGSITVNIGADNQEIVAGEGGALYPLTLVNTGSGAKTVTITPEVSDWATITVSPSNVVTVRGGKSEPVFVYVSAKEGVDAGQKLFALTVKSGDNTQQMTFKANVVENDSAFGGLKKGLEIGLIVLVVLLIVLGLIIAFNRLRNSDDEDEDKDMSQTYY